MDLKNIDLKNINLEDIKQKVLQLADRKTLIKVGISVGAIIIFLIISVFFGALPFLVPEYLISTLILFFVWSVVAQSWNLVWGIAGLWSLGQMAIFAM